MADSYHDYTQKVEEKTDDNLVKAEDNKISELIEIEKNFEKFTVPITNVDNEQPRNSYYSVLSNRDKYSIAVEHCYARPPNWKPEHSFLKPTKTLFIPKTPLKTTFPCQFTVVENEDDENIDVESVDSVSCPIYDVNKGKQLMEECENHIKLFKTDNGNNEWDENIWKHNWTPTQTRLFNGIISVLNNHQLAKLASSGTDYEAIFRRTVIDKSVQRIRRLMATVFWDQKVTQWLHQLLIENLSAEYLAIYLDILQTMKAKLPSFVEKMIYGQNVFKVGAISADNLMPMLKRPWDPVLSSLMQDKPKKLPGNPLILIVPSSPIPSNRYAKWVNLLSNLGTVMNISFNLGTPGQRLTTIHYVDQMFASVRGQIQEIKSEHPNRNIVLMGFNAGASLALQIAQVEQVFAVICLSFSLLTAEGKRGEPDDSLLELQSPVLFIIGQCSTTSSQEEMEDLRERMRVETGLVVVGSADNFLRISKKKKRAEGITQSIVDRCIVDEIGEFISSLILSPFPPQIRQSPTPTVNESTPSKKLKNERQRYNSNASSLDSEDHLSPIPPRITRPVGRPPGSKIKSKLDMKWAAQVAQAKMQAYGMAKNNIVSGSRLSTLLQGGIKTIPPTHPKNSSPTIKDPSVLENVTLIPGNSKMMLNNLNKPVTISNASSNVRQSGNLIITSDGKIKKVSSGGIIKGPKYTKYVTSKKQLMGNKPPKPIRKMSSFKSPQILKNALPPPTNLTTQDIMDLPIIFADDNEILEPSSSDISPQLPQTKTIKSTIASNQTSKIITPGSKFVLVNKPISFNSNNQNFMISHTPTKRTTNIYRQAPKYTKIILSKKNNIEEMKPINIISKIANLSPEISVKKVEKNQVHVNQIDNFDLESELIATTIPKPLFSSSVKNITVMSPKIIKSSGSYVKNIEDSITKISESLNNEDDDSDPDYIPPKISKLN